MAEEKVYIGEYSEDGSRVKLPTHDVGGDPIPAGTSLNTLDIGARQFVVLAHGKGPRTFEEVDAFLNPPVEEVSTDEGDAEVAPEGSIEAEPPAPEAPSSLAPEPPARRGRSVPTEGDSPEG